MHGALARLGFLARIKATDAAAFRGFDTLACDVNNETAV
jgi:hypothetical protein